MAGDDLQVIAAEQRGRPRGAARAGYVLAVLDRSFDAGEYPPGTLDRHAGCRSPTTTTGHGEQCMIADGTGPSRVLQWSAL